MSGEKIMRHSGVRFRALASPKDINLAVQRMQARKKESMYEVAKELADNGMIQIIPGEPDGRKDDSCL